MTYSINNICNNEPIKLNINKNQDVLFIDLSYYLFYRYYAYIQWFQKAKKIELTTSNIEEEFSKNEIMEHFKTLCLNKIFELKKKYKIKDNNNIYLLKDCSRISIWRNNVINNYKDGRQQNLFVKSLYIIGIQEVLTNSKLQVISNDTLEADDLAYLSIKELKENNPDYKNQIIVITNDNDYIQLLKFDNIKLYNLLNKDIGLRNKNESIDIFLKLKIINGDIADNIKNIFEHINNKKIYNSNLNKYIKITKTLIEHIVRDEELFNIYIKNNKDKKIYDNYLKNKKLIDFTEIPEQYNNIINYISV